jgi:hypothetical protein
VRFQNISCGVFALAGELPFIILKLIKWIDRKHDAENTSRRCRARMVIADADGAAVLLHNFPHNR